MVYSAFAGSGTRTVEKETGGLLSDTPVIQETEELAGPVLRALAEDPPFNRHVFIEGQASRFRELDAIRKARPDQSIECRHGDANAGLRSIFTTAPWRNQIAGRGKHRACVFLDPYGMNVEWETLRLLADTKAAHVWYLFPVLAVTRQLAWDMSRVDESKASKLDSIFGTFNWRKELYNTHMSVDLFDTVVTTSVRKVTQPQIEVWSGSHRPIMPGRLSDLVVDHIERPEGPERQSRSGPFHASLGDLLPRTVSRFDRSPGIITWAAIATWA